MTEGDRKAAQGPVNIDLGSEVCFDRETNGVVEVGEKVTFVDGQVFHSKYVIDKDGLARTYDTMEVKE